MPLYSVRNSGSDLEHQSLGTRVVNQKLQVFQAHSNLLKHKIYFDNFFTNYNLLSSFGEQNLRGVETIQENRSARASKSVVSS